MREFRHEALDIFFAKPMPTWGADLSGIDFDEIIYYLRPIEGGTAARAGTMCPKTSRTPLTAWAFPRPSASSWPAWAPSTTPRWSTTACAQEWEKLGVIFLDMDTGLREHEDLVREYFATIIPAADNKFAALNSAVWSGGSFVYVPKGVHVDIPLQAYFRINAQNMGQFERTLIIVEEGASMHYVEGCTAPIYSAATACTAPWSRSSSRRAPAAATRRSRTGAPTSTTW